MGIKWVLSNVLWDDTGHSEDESAVILNGFLQDGVS